MNISIYYENFDSPWAIITNNLPYAMKIQNKLDVCPSGANIHIGTYDLLHICNVSTLLNVAEQ